ncbi:MAG TPA: hypothetical protein VGO00_04670 [Kofleriaceae bacterium]|jgi:hypothetical protein|nr:hypothetical protein [Kofleriaceae bacterium]
MKKFLILALLLAAACGSKSDKSSDTAAGGGDACTVATAKAVDQMIGSRLKRMESRAGSDMTDRKAKVEEQAVQLKTVLAKHCNDDKWAADVVDCFGAAATREAMQACRAKLPQDQQQALMADEMKVMMAGRGSGMRGMGGGFRHDGMGSAMGSGAPQPNGSATTPPSTGSGSAAATPAAGSGSAK